MEDLTKLLRTLFPSENTEQIVKEAISFTFQL